MKKRFVILGGGVSGLSLAWKLAEKGQQVTVLEARADVGGLAGTVYEDGFALDYGPHSFFSENQKMVDVFEDLFSHSLKPLKRRVKFFYQGRYLDYPFTPSGILVQMGFFSGLKAVLSFLKESLFPSKKTLPNKEQSVEEWAIHSFGEQLYKGFFKPYTEQFWKMPCSELSARSIPAHTRVSFLNTLKVMLMKPVVEKGASQVERENLPTYYPKTGYAEYPEKIAEKIREYGGEVKLKSRVTKLEKLESGCLQVTYESSEGESIIEADHATSTIPIPNFVKMIHPKPPQEILDSLEFIDYRPILVLGLVTKKQNILGDAMYIYQMDRPYNRIFEANKFSEGTSPEGYNILGCEIACQRTCAEWNASEEDLYKQCIETLTKDGFLTEKDVERTMLIKSPYAYPIYRLGYAEHLDRVLSYIQQYEGLSALGRMGEFRYTDTDKCMASAFELAEVLSTCHSRA